MVTRTYVSAPPSLAAGPPHSGSPAVPVPPVPHVPPVPLQPRHCGRGDGPVQWGADEVHHGFGGWEGGVFAPPHRGGAALPVP